MTLTPTEQNILLTIIGFVITTFLGFLAWIGKSMVNKMGGIETVLNQIKNELGILTNDHTNLKEDVKEVKHRVDKLESKK